ncbi:hypothetical protein [Microbacterium paludicola]|uniref:hypothetical protein n=1 Tax=Microbacterium paludicola TaxID=300019 RepID=UPI0031D4B4D8
MAYDEELADRIRAYVPDTPETREIRMFGGLCWTMRGHMVAGAIRSELLIPLGELELHEALARGAHPLSMGQRTMSGFVGLSHPTDEQLDEWIAAAVARSLTRPPKPPKTRTPRAP